MLHKVHYSAEDYFLFFKKGEEQGFTYFYHLYFSELFQYARSILNDQTLTEDVLEDCFVKFWEKRMSIESPTTVKSYLYSAVRNTCFNVLNKEKYKARYAAYVKNLNEQFEHDASKKVIASESMQQVHHAIKMLPPRQRKLIEMIYLEEKKLKEVAAELKLPLSTVKYQKAKAIQLLREQLPNLTLLVIVLFLK